MALTKILLERLLQLIARKELKYWIIASIFFHFMAAFFSQGFLHFDEHFQILEFLQFKLHPFSSADLPWEFHAQMRPWTQPAFYYVLTKALNLMGLTNQYTFATIFRIISAGLGIFSSFLLAIWSETFFKERWKSTLSTILIFILWFYPYLHARISSEAVSTSFFVIGLSLIFLEKILLVKQRIIPFILYAFILGISAQVRYQIGISIVFSLLWIIWHKLLNRRQILAVFLGLTLATSLGILIDYWGYGSLSFPVINYLKQNLVVGKAANFGTTPWHGYFRMIFGKAIFPFGILIILSYFFFWIKRPKDLITWITLPFFLIHIAISHKEYRFLFPLAPFIPIVSIYFISALKLNNHHINTLILKILLYLVVFENFFLMVMSSFMPAHRAIDFYKMSQSFDIKNLYILGGQDPFRQGDLPMHYYREGITPKGFLANFSRQAEPEYWVYGNRGKFYFEVKADHSCTLQYLSVPEWALNLNIGHWQSRSNIWSLFSCKN